MDEPEIPTPAPAPPKMKNRGGWPKGRPRKQAERRPLLMDALIKEQRASTAQSFPDKSGSRWNMTATPNWEVNDMNAPEGVDRFHIPKDEIPEGFDLQWVTDSVMGQPVPQHRQQFERKGWTPVHQVDFDARFNGRWQPKGQKGEINDGGMVLMARPIELSIKSRERERRAALEQVRIKEQQLHGGDMPGVMGADHPSALGANRINRTIERIEVPRDDS